MLKHSYAFAFFRYPSSSERRDRSRSTRHRKKEKQLFEQLQAELEMMTEQMSDVVARKHIRATQPQIQYLTKDASNKRYAMTTLMLRTMQAQRREAKEEANEPAAENTRLSFSPSDRHSGSAYDFRLHRRPGNAINTIERGRHNLNRSNPYGEMDRDRLIVPRPTMLDASDDSDDNDPMSVMRELYGGDVASLHEVLRASVQPHMRLGTPAAPNEYRAGFFHDNRGGLGENEFDGMDDELPHREDWSCSLCTYMNSTGHVCAMCGTARA